MLVKDIVLNSANEQKIQNQTEKKILLSDNMFSYKI